MKQLIEKYGLRRLERKIRRTVLQWREERDFAKWVECEEKSRLENRQTIHREIENLKHTPLISVLMPVYNVEEKWLRSAIESVIKQLYKNWELCIADDCSPSPHVRKVLEEYAAQDARIKVIFRVENGHISAASNSVLEIATGEFVALLDHDDELSEDALFYVAKEINDFPAADLIYSDEDSIDENGRRYQPKFKPDWSRDLFYSVNLLTHLIVYRTEIVRQMGGFRLGSEGSQDYDLALRAVERIPENHIRHIPKILYHWRAIHGSVAFSSDEKPYAHERAREALRAHFERIGKKAKVSRAVYNLHRVRYELPEDLPKVSLIISADEDSQAASRAIKNYGENTNYENLEIILICPEAVREKLETQDFPPDTKFINCKKESAAECFNRAVSQADGEILCFASASFKPLLIDWLSELTSFAIQKEIAAVGAKLLSADETILHGGLIVGTKDIVGIAHHHFPRESSGNFGRAQLVNNFSAVSISSMTVRREVFHSVGGFDAENFPNVFFDADFCLRLRERNLRIVFTPYAELIQVEEKKLLNVKKKPTEREMKFFRNRWKSVFRQDPFYNPNLSYKNGMFSIEI